MLKTAQKFATSLDQDNFPLTKTTLSPNCQYIIGSETLTGPEAICHSYEQNMLEGRAKLDKLEWGQSEIEVISDSEYVVHFTDFLTHKGIQFTHQCKQKLSFNEQGKIMLIEHIDDPEGQARLDDFYRTVGLKA